MPPKNNLQQLSHLTQVLSTYPLTAWRHREAQFRHLSSRPRRPRSSVITRQPAWWWWTNIFSTLTTEDAGVKAPPPQPTPTSWPHFRGGSPKTLIGITLIHMRRVTTLPTLRLTRRPVFRLLQDPIIRRVPGCPILDNLPPPHITTDIFKIFLFCIWLLKPFKSCVTDPKLLLFVFILTTWLDRKTVIKDISYFSKGSQNKFILKFSMNGKKF